MGTIIPLSDVSRRPKSFPAITLLIIIVNVLVFVRELIGGEAFVLQWAAVPAEIVARHHLITILTSMFMHGSWLHIIGNMVFLWAFGPEIEDAMGPARYLVFYLTGGVAAMLAQVAASPHSTVPTLGASGAIAAVMGAFIVTYPRDKIKTLLFLGWFVTIAMLPAALLIGLWIVTQLFSQVGSVANVQAGGVAYMAHIGGFFFGAIAGRLFESSDRTAED